MSGKRVARNKEHGDLTMTIQWTRSERNARNKAILIVARYRHLLRTIGQEFEPAVDRDFLVQKATAEEGEFVGEMMGHLVDTLGK